MTSRKNIQDVRIRKPATTVPQTRAFPSAKRARGLPPVFEADPRTDTASRPADYWSTGFAIFGLCVLATALVAYVLYPAMDTLLDASVITWSGEGP
jgi:hypothetical protein